MLVHRRHVARGTAAVAACTGLLLPLLAAPPAAAAGPTAVVTVEPLGHSDAGAAGACLLYRVVPRDGAFEESITSSGRGFVTVTLTEVADLAQQDVDFCAAGGRGDTFSRAPRYAAGHETASITQVYNPGETRTPEEGANPVKARQDVPPAATSTNPTGRPDVAAVEASPSPTPANNVKSTDSATIGYDGDAGGFVFGVVGLVAGSARISAFFDLDGDGTADTGAPTPLDPGGDVPAEDVTVQFSSGGAPWSLTAANAARSLEATAESADAIAGSPRGAALVSVVRNAEGHPLAGVMPRVAAEEGPNASSPATGGAPCGASDSTGRASCSFTSSASGTDTVAIWVNQSVSGATAGRDPGEPYDTLTVRSAAPASSDTTASPSASARPSPSTSGATSPPTPTTPARECATAVTLDPSVITATQDARIVVTAAPGQDVQLHAYSRPSTTYRPVREGRTGADGQVAFVVRPVTNTRLYASEQGCPSSASHVVQVRPVVSMSTSRVGVRDVVFRGRVVPARVGQLVSLYRTTTAGQHVLTAQARVNGDGTWSVRKVFSGTGRFSFVAQTGADMVNAAGVSPVRVVDVR